MKITWLGQAGLLFEKDDFKIIIDPYLSNSVEKFEPNNKRRFEVDESFLKIKPDVLICTHNHLDHFDPETMPVYLNNFEGITVLAPESAYYEARKIGGKHNFIKFNRHTQWTQNEITFYAVKAEHSDVHPIGVIIDDGGKKYYITGDTLYNSEIFDDIPEDIFAAFLPINGVGNNMNATDAARFAKKINAKRNVPLHFGLFDNIDPKTFKCDNRVIPVPYREIEL